MKGLMQNAKQLENAYEILKDSAGSAQKESDAFVDSLSGRINALKSALTSISMQMIDSDAFKGLISGATTGVQAVSKLIDIFGAFPSVVGVATTSLVAFNSRIRENTNSMLQAIPWYGKVSTTIKGWSESISKNIEQLQEQKINLKEQQAEALKSGDSTTALGRKMLKLNSDLGILKTGFIATKVAMVAFQAISATLVTMGISLLITGLGKLVDKLILTRSELNELNQEFISTNSDSEMSKVIDLVNSYEKLENTLSTLKEGTSEYKKVEEQLASTQESIISVYPNASKAIEYNTEAKRLNLEATKKLIDKELELSKADALNILEKNDTKTDTGLDEVIEKYQGYYDVLKEVNKLAEKGIEDSINIESNLSDSGELLVNAKDVDVYKKRVEELNDTLEASYEAYKILGVSNEKYAEKAKKVGEVLGYSKQETEKYIDSLKETDENIEAVSDALADLNHDGVIDATDSMLQLAETTDDAKSAVENLGDAFNNLSGTIGILETAIEEFKKYGMIDDSTWSDIITSGNSELIALLADSENFLKNAQELYSNMKNDQEELAQQAIRRATEEVNGSIQVVDALNTEAQAVVDLENTKINAGSNSVNQRANMESILVNNNANNYATDEANHNNKENYKIQGTFVSATNRIKNEAEVTSTNAKNYKIDDENHVSLLNSKIEGNDEFANAVLDGNAAWVNDSNNAYSKDAQNYSSYISSKMEAYREYVNQQANGLPIIAAGGTANYLKDQLEYYKKLKEEFNKLPSKVTPNYVGSGMVSSGSVSHGSVGNSSSSGSNNSSSSSKNEVADIEEKVDWYIKLNNAIDDYNRLLEQNRNAQEHAKGTERIRLIKEEVELVKKQAQAHKNLADAYQVEANQIQAYLQSQGFQFDAMQNLTGDVSEKILRMKQNANKLSGTAKESAIAQIELIKEQIDRFTELTNSSIPSLRGEYEELNNAVLDLYQTQLDVVTQVEKDIYDVIEYYATKKKEAKVEAIESEIEALEKLYALEDKQDELSEKQKSLTELRNQMDLYENAQDSAGRSKYEELKKEYDELLKDLNTTIRDNQKDAITESLEAQKDQLDKDLEEFLSPENINKVISDAMKNGYINLGDEVLNLNDATTQYLAETTIGTQNLIEANTELLNSYLSIAEVMKNISTLNSSLGNISLDMSSVYSGMTRSSAGNSVNFGGVTVQIQGGTNMTQADITNAVQKALTNISDNINRGW